jgi:hypothetical protein
LSQQKCRATWPRFGGIHNYPPCTELKEIICQINNSYYE